MDKDNVIRVGGRLKYAVPPQETKHPAILDPDDRLSKLVIRDVHEKSLTTLWSLTNTGRSATQVLAPEGRSKCQKVGSEMCHMSKGEQEVDKTKNGTIARLQVQQISTVCACGH